MSYDEAHIEHLESSSKRVGRPNFKAAEKPKVSLRTDRNKLASLAREIAERGWIPHHETGERHPVRSQGEAMILLEYGLWCKRLPQKPDEIDQMTEDEEAELTNWLEG